MELPFVLWWIGRSSLWAFQSTHEFPRQILAPRMKMLTGREGGHRRLPGRDWSCILLLVAKTRELLEIYWSQCLLHHADISLFFVSPKDYLAGLLCNRNNRRIGVARGNRRHNRGIHNSEATYTINTKLLVNNRIR